MKKSLALIFLIALPTPLLSKEVPVTKNIIKTQADSVFVGVITKIDQGGGTYISISLDVAEKVFDRNRNVAETVTVNLYGLKGADKYRTGESYVFITSTCASGAQVSLGEQFIASIKNGTVDTRKWHGFAGETKMTELRSELSRFSAKDQFLTNQICKAIFNCDQRTNQRDRKSIP